MGRSLEVLEEACGTLPRVVRKMFGGYGFFAPNGGMFAGIVTDDAIVLKLARGPVRDEFIEVGGVPWVYEGGKTPMTMHEWLVIPDGFYDDFELLGFWLAKAHAIVPPKIAKKAKKTSTPKGKAEAPPAERTPTPRSKKTTSKPTSAKRLPRRK